jgi:hypothetical protein
VDDPFPSAKKNRMRACMCYDNSADPLSQTGQKGQWMIKEVKAKLNHITCSSEALPPTSRKFAGVPPCSLIISIVAIANPAPFTMQPISPSKPI